MKTYKDCLNQIIAILSSVKAMDLNKIPTDGKSVTTPLEDICSIINTEIANDESLNNLTHTKAIVMYKRTKASHSITFLSDLINQINEKIKDICLQDANSNLLDFFKNTELDSFYYPQLKLTITTPQPNISITRSNYVATDFFFKDNKSNNDNELTKALKLFTYSLEKNDAIATQNDINKNLSLTDDTKNDDLEIVKKLLSCTNSDMKNTLNALTKAVAQTINAQTFSICNANILKRFIVPHYISYNKVKTTTNTKSLKAFNSEKADRMLLMYIINAIVHMDTFGKH